MNTTIELNAEATAPNVVQLTIAPKVRREPAAAEHRFKVKEFENASGTKSYRVDGYKRDGARVRENFSDKVRARARQIELETEWLTGEVRTEVQATKLTREQISLAESAFIRLGEDSDLPRAVEYWLTHGKKLSVADSPRLDEAADAFMKWLDATDTLRERTKGKYESRVKLFRNSVPNLRVSDIRADTIKAFFAGRTKVSARTKIGDKEAISRFFEWCIRHEPQWTAINPCRGVEIEIKDDGRTTPVLSVDECKKLMAAAEKQGGDMATYLAVCLFGALRPTEAERLTWRNVNMVDGEITIEAQASKRKKSRTIKMSKTLLAWLTAYQDMPFHPTNSRRTLDTLKLAAGFVGRGAHKDGQPWISDILRKTGISHHFRKTGSYGLTAEFAGNSEQIIKDHYQGKVNSEDTKKFYAIMPKRGVRK